MVGPTWIVVAQHVPFGVGAARLVSLLAFTDLHQHGSLRGARACGRVKVRARARACVQCKEECFACVRVLWWGEELRRAHIAVRLRGLVQNAAGSSPVSALSARSMLATAGSKAIAAGTVPTKRFRCKALRTAAAQRRPA